MYRCPVCRAKTEVIRVFEDGKTLAIRCNKSHFYGTKTVWGKTEEIYKENEVFIIELDGKEDYTWPPMLKEYAFGRYQKNKKLNNPSR
jgi:hypothetical protein